MNARAGLEEQPEPGGTTSSGLQALEFMQPAASPQDIEASTGRQTYLVYKDTILIVSGVLEL